MAYTRHCIHWELSHAVWGVWMLFLLIHCHSNLFVWRVFLCVCVRVRVQSFLTIWDKRELCTLVSVCCEELCLSQPFSVIFWQAALWLWFQLYLIHFMLHHRVSMRVLCEVVLWSFRTVFLVKQLKVTQHPAHQRDSIKWHLYLQTPRISQNGPLVLWLMLLSHVQRNCSHSETIASEVYPN